MDHLSSTILMCAILLLCYASGTVKGEQAALGATCTVDGGCINDPAECKTDGTGFKCVCESAFYNSGDDCEFRKKPDEGCTANQCVANAVCNTTDNKCDCNTGYRATPTSNPTSCEIVAFGDSCTIDIGCGEDNNVCSNSTCVCSDTSSRNTAGDACVNSSDAATIMLAHMHVFIFGTVASLYFLV